MWKWMLNNKNMHDSRGVPKTSVKLDFTGIFGEMTDLCRPLCSVAPWWKDVKVHPFCSPTKASLYGAILFTLQETHWLPASKSTLILVCTLFMATSKVGPRKHS